MDRTTASAPEANRRTTLRGYALVGAWSLCTIGLGWFLLQGQSSFDTQATLPALAMLLICTALLLWWLGSTRPALPNYATRTRRGRFALLLMVAVAVLFPLRTLVGPPLLFGLPVLAVAILALARPHLDRAAVAYALGLALVAGVAGLAAGWVSFPPLAWAGLQVALVLPGLLAGWSVLRQTGLLEAGIGRTLWLTAGPTSALREFGIGMLVALPWALGSIVMGSADQETWVRHWWQPFIAIQPGIAEEAWGRVLLVPLLFLAFRRVARPRLALTTAVVLLAYWFAYLHTSGGVGGIISTLMIGTVFALPISYLWLRRGLETAVGFHFMVDFAKFVAAYLLFQGL